MPIKLLWLTVASFWKRRWDLAVKVKVSVCLYGGSYARAIGLSAVRIFNQSVGDYSYKQVKASLKWLFLWNPFSHKQTFLGKRLPFFSPDRSQFLKAKYSWNLEVMLVEGHLKMPVQIPNLHKPNSKTNAEVFAMFHAKDSWAKWTSCLEVDYIKSSMTMICVQSRLQTYFSNFCLLGAKSQWCFPLVTMSLSAK